MCVTQVIIDIWFGPKILIHGNTWSNRVVQLYEVRFQICPAFWSHRGGNWGLPFLAALRLSLHRWLGSTIFFWTKKKSLTNLFYTFFTDFLHLLLELKAITSEKCLVFLIIKFIGHFRAVALSELTVKNSISSCPIGTLINNFAKCFHTNSSEHKFRNMYYLN